MASVPTSSTEVADVDFNENKTPYSRTFDDVYFSTTHGLNESYYVFFQGNSLDIRWQKKNFGLDKIESVFSIGETGFGTGLNFLITWREWLNAPPPKPRLHFYSSEKHPLSKEAIQNALTAWPELEELSQQLIEAYPPQAHNGLYRLVFAKGQVCLTIYFGDATTGFSHLLPSSLPNTKISELISSAQNDTSTVTLPRIHAWFFDGFSPSKNPNMWSRELFDTVVKLSSKNTTFATFTAASNVRRSLDEFGFNCEKRRGFGLKREMLQGAFVPRNKKIYSTCDAPPSNRSRNSQDYESWHVSGAPVKKIENCLVIGGGLAGCHTAFALACRGIKVALLEEKNQLAAGASGNAQGIVYAKLSANRSPRQSALSYFNYYALLFANNFYQTNGFYQSVGEQCGVLQLAASEKQRLQFQDFIKSVEETSHFQWLTPEECSAKAGVKINHHGLFIKNAGWLSPPELCSALTNHPNISVKRNSEVLSITSSDAEHTLKLKNKSEISANAIVFTNAHQALNFEHCDGLPLKSIRGQVTHLPPSHSAENLACVICGDGYVAPMKNQICTTGASFNLSDSSYKLSRRDHIQNLERLHTLSPDFSCDYTDDNTDYSDGRVGFRCTTPDYFPIAGPLTNRAAMKERFKHYSKNASARIDDTGIVFPNSFALLGLGSRGLTYAPLAAEIIASQICNEFSPIEQDIVRHLHPARFLVRDLKRNKESLE